MNHGLPDSSVRKIHAVFKRYPAIERAVLYGSRAKGNFKPGSDIDLTLLGNDLAHKQLESIAEELDELLLPYTIDLSLYAELDHPALRAHIEHVGVQFYPASQAADQQ